MTNQLDPADPGSNLAFAQALGQINAAANSNEVTLGTIVSFTSASLQVAVKGTPVLQNAAYLLAPHYKPCMGDTVVLLRFGGSWLCLGATSLPPADNVVYNGSFELATGGVIPQSFVTSPDGWQTVVTQPDAGTPSALWQAHTDIQGGEIDGNWVLEFSFVGGPAPGVATYQSRWNIISNPVPVVPGETFAGYAYGRVAWDDFSAPLSQLTMSCDIAFFANSTTLTPLSIAGGQNIFMSTSVANDWTQLLNIQQPRGAVAPASAQFMRVQLWHQVEYQFYAPQIPTGSIAWDRVVIRKIYNADGSLAVVPSA